MLRATLYLNIQRSPQQSRDHLVQEFFILGGVVGGGVLFQKVQLKKKFF